MSSIVQGLAVLMRVDRADMLLREPLTLRAIQTNPGLNGSDICQIIGLPERSAIQNALARLVKKGLIEDRRVTEGKAHPSIYHITPEGEKMIEHIFRA